ncbi:MAG: hypothetical protein K1X94_08490 [Sandaracinaceae bacterium]|jgi:hypothetical protein|nr:hypothetical protein [Sandaracinaceae bacterium]
MNMFVCAACSSFVPPASRACPACGQALTPTARVVGGALALAGGSLFAVTLTACYGVAEPIPERDAAVARDTNAMGLTSTCTDATADLDGDGYCGELDCDEANPNVHVGAFDQFGDHIDADCGGTDAID